MRERAARRAREPRCEPSRALVSQSCSIRPDAEPSDALPRQYAVGCLDSLRQKVAELEARLKADSEAHDKLRKVSSRLLAEKDSVREVAKQSELLVSIVEQQQKCLGEALQAGSWTVCRQILYHESLRYVQTAATHGKLLGKSFGLAIFVHKHNFTHCQNFRHHKPPTTTSKYSEAVTPL